MQSLRCQVELGVLFVAMSRFDFKLITIDIPVIDVEHTFEYANNEYPSLIWFQNFVYRKYHITSHMVICVS